MKRKIALLVVVAVILTSCLCFSGAESNNAAAATTPTTAFQRVNYVNAVVTASYLNVRQGPSTSFPVVCVLKKGQTVKVFGKLGNWYAVYEPGKKCVGAVSGAYIKQKGTTTAKTTTPKTTTPKTTTTPGTTAKSATVNPPTGISADEQSLLNLVNKARTGAGVSAMEFDMGLMKVARAKAKDMVDNNYFSHQSPTYGSPFDMMKQFGVAFNTAGENIAGNRTVEGAFNAWMNSEGHRKNIMNASFNYTGIGIVSSPTYGKILVQQFIGK